MADKLKKRIEKLREEIRRHDYLYYVLNQPQISDRQYDKLFVELKELERQNPQLITPDSPTQRVSGSPLEGFTSVRHTVPMLSMDNTYNPDELKAFDERVEKQLGSKNYDYVVELKIDGVAVNLRYEDGKLITAATRGDGRLGDDVTTNVRTIKAIPLVLLDAPPFLLSQTAKGVEQAQVDDNKVPRVLEVRGEVYMPTKSFVELNKVRTQAGEPLFANPRNATAGSLKLLDARITAERNLAFFAYSIGEISQPLADNHYQTLQRFKKFGLPVNPNIKKAKNINEVIDICLSWSDKRLKLDYQIDGMVIKVNRFDQRDVLGATGMAPRWCISYKFPAEQAQTVIESIDIQVGKSGILTPVANLKSVQLSGTTVKRASLHNFDEIKRLDVRRGDTVLIEKAGEIIPQVVQVIHKLRPPGTAPLRIAKKCPICHSAVVKDKDGVYIRCANSNCVGQLKERLKYFAGRGQMDIETLGDALIEQLINTGLVKNFADLYKLQASQLIELERMAEKSADNVIKAVEASKTRPLWRFIAALGIRHIGSQSAQNMSNYFRTIEKVLSVDRDELKKIKKQEKDKKELLKKKRDRHEISGEEYKEKRKELRKNERLKDIGDEMIDSFCDYIEDPKNKSMIKELISVGVKLEPPKDGKVNGKLAGKTIVVTGTLQNFSRQQIEEAIRGAGGKPSSSVSKKTSFVVAGEDAGSKLDEARQLQIKVIDENEFLQIIQKKLKLEKES